MLRTGSGAVPANGRHGASGTAAGRCRDSAIGLQPQAEVIMGIAGQSGRLNVASALAALLVVFGLLAIPAHAQDSGAEAAAAVEPGEVPVAVRTVIRFLTSDDYPPFNYLDEEGTLTGFNIDVARAICLALDVTCDIRPLPFDELMPTLQRGGADAVIASHAITARTLEQAEFSDRYYFTPARFTARKAAETLDISPIGLEGVRVGVVKDSAHEAYMNQYFRDCVIVPFESLAAAQAALTKDEVALLFADGVTQVFWLNGASSASCCEFRGGPFFDERYFGSGVGVAVRKDDLKMRRELNKALAQLRKNGRFEELQLRYFPSRAY